MKTKWKIDKLKSRFGFSIRHSLFFKVKGSFHEFEAEIFTTDKDFTTLGIDLVMDVASIDTGDEEMNDWLKASDLLDTSRHPQLAFTSHGMSTAGENGISELWGELNLKGISRRICLLVKFIGNETDKSGTENSVFSIQFEIDRTLWNLEFNKGITSPAFLISKRIQIDCSVNITKSIHAMHEPYK